MKIAVTAVLLLLAQAASAGVDGRWVGMSNMMGQQVPVEYTFKAEGKTLTGTAPAGPGQTVPLTGSVDGDKISFQYETKFQKMKMRFRYKGTIKGDEMELTSKNDGAPGLTGRIAAPPPKLVLKRVP